MKTKAVGKILLAASLASAMAMSGSALAQNINTIETTVASGTTGVSITSDPVITAILSQPGTTDGKTYSSWSFLVNDGTGSMDVFASGASLTGLGFTPTVGETLSLTGEYSPYQQIPEMETLTAISSTGTASVPAIGTTTIPNINVATLPYSLAGYESTLDNVTISGGLGTPFGTANQTLTVTDGSANSMELYYWESSYSSALANLDGFLPIAGQEYDVTGFASVYTPTGGSAEPQFNAISIVAVPEPASLALFGIGGVLSMMLVLRRRSAI